MRLTILGNNSALPAYGRHPTAQLLSVDGEEILVDCGEGALAQMMALGLRWNRINRVLISHLHGDHYFGLFGLLTSMNLFGRLAPMHIHGPAELEPIIQTLTAISGSALSYPIHFHPLPDVAALIADTSVYEVRSFPVEHRIFCCGFRITAKTRGRRILPEVCAQYDIPFEQYKALKQGEDFIAEAGEVVSNAILTANGPEPRSYAYCADTRYTTSFLPHIAGADLLYHESTYLNIDEEKATARFHSTAGQAGAIASAAGVKRLLLGHYSSRYEVLKPFADEASKHFPAVVPSEEGKQYDV